MTRPKAPNIPDSTSCLISRQKVPTDISISPSLSSPKHASCIILQRARLRIYHGQYKRCNKVYTAHLHFDDHGFWSSQLLNIYSFWRSRGRVKGTRREDRRGSFDLQCFKRVRAKNQKVRVSWAMCVNHWKESCTFWLEGDSFDNHNGNES